MRGQFSVLEHHIQEVRKPNPLGGLVLSRLDKGQSLIGAGAPSVKMVLEGEEIYEVDGRSVRILPGQFLYLGPGASCIGSNRTFTTGICLMLPAGQTQSEMPSGWDPLLGRSLVFSTATSRLGSILEEQGRAIANDPTKGEALAGPLIRQVEEALAQPLAESRTAIEGMKAAKASTRRELYQRLERARGFLHANDQRQVRLDELACVAGLSQFHLARYFKMAFGEAPIGYHRNLRLARAARHLNGVFDCKLSDVAEMAGYSDEVSLSHAFRRRFGQAPKQWAAC